MGRLKYGGVFHLCLVLYDFVNNRIVSVHVNWPGGLKESTWPAHDPVGYSEAEKSMCAYGRANFSAAECRRRALPPGYQQDDGNEDATTGDARPSTNNDAVGPPAPTVNNDRPPVPNLSN